tara:strand:- start:183 stop:656 length:474 start_codon:yes stop_codon:yes gene_type:complete
MSNSSNLKPFEKGISGNPNGRPKGTRNRATIVREIFDSISVLDSFKLTEIEKWFPHVKCDMSIEYLMTLVQVNKAIFKEDTKAYKVLMDTMYGTPIRQLDLDIRNKELEIEREKKEQDKLDISELSVLELRILLKAFNGSDEQREDLQREYDELNKA